MTYICPVHKKKSQMSDNKLICKCNCAYPLTSDLIPIVDFSKNEKKEIYSNGKIYSSKTQNEIYCNFLNWLFATFKTNDYDFRMSIFSKLSFSKRDKILITGCGNGDDIIALNKIHKDKELYIEAQDISSEMIIFTANRLKEEGITNCRLSISNACNLPYSDGYFDLAFHLGGINMMSDTKIAIMEMTRVVKESGQVAFIDEGIAPWLRGSEFSDMMINNNQLWSNDAPINKLPFNATHVQISWLLENCFYYIRFIKGSSFPDIDLNVPHIGKRGGTIKTRYFGQLEGVSKHAKEIALEGSRKSEKSIYQWLDKIIKDTIKAD